MSFENLGARPHAHRTPTGGGKALTKEEHEEQEKIMAKHIKEICTGDPEKAWDPYQDMPNYDGDYDNGA